LTPVQTSIALAVAALVAIALAGLVARGHVRISRSFGAYLAYVLVYDLLVTLWPARFWNWYFWHFGHTVMDALKIAVALELAYWIFLGFPAAAQSARAVIFLLLVGTLATVLALPNEAGQDAGGYLFGTLRLRFEIGAAWIFTALAGLIQWYRLPVHPLHSGIMYGFVPYLLVFSTVMRAVADYGWSQWLVTIEPAAYLAACGCWAWTAWRPAPVVGPAVALLQPWRVRARC
jgi:hypothetical protein